MRLPLLVCGTPKNLNGLAPVRIPPGKWKVVFENHQNTITHPLMGSVHEFPIPTIMTLQIIEAGTETNLNIYAEKIE